MAETTLKLILPKWCMATLRAANPLADWAIKGVRVR